MMGPRRKKSDKELTSDPVSLLLKSTLKSNCGCCNKSFSEELRKTRKFIINTPPGQTINAYQGIQDIFLWKNIHLNGLIDENLALCSSCGIIIAKLYTAIKLFEDATSELSYLSKILCIAQERKWKDAATDTGVDEAETQAEIAAMEYEDNNENWGDYPSKPGVKKSFLIKDNSNKEFRCEHCTAGFDKQSYLTRHLLLSHEIGDRQKDFVCGVCGKAFYFSYLLKNHERIHGEERPFVCTLLDCSTSFKTREGLYAHVRNYHRHDRPFKCPYCDKAFKEKRSRRVHVDFLHKISRGVKLWTCQFCKTKFRRKSGLASHLKKQCLKNPNRSNNVNLSLSENAEILEHSSTENNPMDIHSVAN